MPGPRRWIPEVNGVVRTPPCPRSAFMAPGASTTFIHVREHRVGDCRVPRQPWCGPGRVMCRLALPWTRVHGNATASGPWRGTPFSRVRRPPERSRSPSGSTAVAHLRYLSTALICGAGQSTGHSRVSLRSRLVVPSSSAPHTANRAASWSVSSLAQRLPRPGLSSVAPGSSLKGSYVGCCPG